MSRYIDIDYICFVIDCCDLQGGDCLTALTSFGRFPEYVAQKFIAEVINAVKVLHDHAVVHRDIKPDNIMVCLLLLFCRKVIILTLLVDHGSGTREAHRLQSVLHLSDASSKTF